MPKRRKPQAPKALMAQTSPETSSLTDDGRPAYQRGLNRGNPGNKGGGRLPKEYIEWLGDLLDSPAHRVAFGRIIRDDGNKLFMEATKHAANRKHGLPVQSVQVSGIIVHVSGGGIPMQRIDLTPVDGADHE